MRMTGLGIARIPVVPLILGLGGLIPFWGLAIALGFGGIGPWNSATTSMALAIYAAIILSFLGGIRWGLAVGQGEAQATRAQYVFSIVPPLAGWAVMAAAEPWRLAGLGLLLIGLGPIDFGLVRAGLAAPWFGRLRLILSGGAGVALLLGAALWHG